MIKCDAVVLANGDFPVHAVPLSLLENAVHIVACDGAIAHLTAHEYQADVNVYVVDHEYQADLLVYVTDHEYDAKSNEGKWYFVDHEYQADVKIYFVDHEYQADLTICFVRQEYNAGWRKNSKKHLMYKSN